MRQALGIEKSPPSSCSVPLISPKRVDLPAPLRPTRPTFSPGIDGDRGLVEQGLGATAQGDVSEDDHG
jgi:hypothetical protein